MNARTAALALLGVFVVLLVVVHATPVASSGPSVTPPTITAAPSDPSTSAAATFTFAGGEGATFQCSVDRAPQVACASPASYPRLGQGEHSFSVQSVVTGAVSVSTSHDWVIDSVAPPAPLFTRTPPDPTPNATNSAEWRSAEAGVAFECSLENRAFTACTSPLTWVIDTTNNQQHQIAVRSVDTAGNVSPTSSYRFKYQKGLPDSGVPFTVTGSATGLTPGVWRPVVATVSNPSPVPIRVTSITVTVAADSTPPGCASATNLELQPSTVSTSVVLLVPAGGSVTLPAQGVTTPQIRLRNLPTVNQDGCKDKSFALTWSGTATN